jgi:cephalosporin-C deacetylase-like acetyl esterase
MGRHVIGYEIQRILAGVDCLEAFGATGALTSGPPRIGIAGYGEGGLLALYSSALDKRIDSTLVSGYFRSRQNLWEEPIYRNVFGLLNEFGDAEVATLIAPRTLIVEYSRIPEVHGPPPAHADRQGAAPGRLTQPEFAEVQAEINRTKAFFPPDRPFPLGFVHATNEMPVLAGSQVALQSFLEALSAAAEVPGPVSTNRVVDARPGFKPEARQERQVKELVQFTQGLVRSADRARNTFLWERVTIDRKTDWHALIKDYRRYFHDEIIGRLPHPSVGANPRSRRIVEKPKWSAFELVLDVYPEVFAWAYVLIPEDLRSGERRPVVVCQHGLEGLPEDMVSAPGDSGYSVYKGLASRLADRGFIVVAPHDPYRGGDSFRRLQRRANPIKKTLFSVITGQHQRILQWLSAQTYIDPKRIAFYGISYGGKTAMRIPAVVDGYALSICSADFTEWIWKNTLVDSPYSYLYTGQYEMPEFNLGNTFNYAEMAALIAPRPFMVERGHDDPVSPDEWVAHEYAKVRRFYTKLAYPERTTIDFFDGGHTIHGVGTFQFLYRHLDFTRR